MTDFLFFTPHSASFPEMRAAYDVAPEYSVVRLLKWLAGQPFPGEPLGCAINIFRRSEIRADQSVAIIDIDFLDALLTRVASNAGAPVIAAFSKTVS